MADKFREIEAYLKAKIHQAEGMCDILGKKEYNNGLDALFSGAVCCNTATWWDGMKRAYEDVHRILFSNDIIKIDINETATNTTTV